MGKLKGFKEIKRETHKYLPPEVRKKHFNNFIESMKHEKASAQGARCMDCGTPFCHVGCPLGNVIPDFNHQIYLGNYRKAYRILKSTNNFPGITGRICPAPCESSCVLAINKPAVSIKTIELAIAEEAENKGWRSETSLPKIRTGKKVAVVGSGPAGLAAADQLNQAGHNVTVYERSDNLGGLLTYGVPNFKLEKKIVLDEIQRMRNEGVEFVTGVEIGKDTSVDTLADSCDAIILAIGSSVPRDLMIENRDAKGIHFAMPYLTQATKQLLNQPINTPIIDVAGKDVLVIGGGDTGSDCVGTSIRKKASSVTQIEIMPIPPKERDASMPWPQYERIFRISSSQEEGCQRFFSVLTTRFIKKGQEVSGLEIEDVEWNPQRSKFEKTGSKRILKAQIVLLALGFLHPEQHLAKTLQLKLDEKKNYAASQNDYATSREGVFVAGDVRRGQSLVVWAISEGRECAKSVDEYLQQGMSTLRAKNYDISDASNKVGVSRTIHQI